MGKPQYTPRLFTVWTFIDSKSLNSWIQNIEGSGKLLYWENISRVVPLSPCILHYFYAPGLKGPQGIQ